MGEKPANDAVCSPEHVAMVHRLFVTHTRDLLGYLIVFAPDSSQVDDLLHDVFLRVTNKAESFIEGTNFLAWARAIARNILFEAARKNQQYPFWTLSPQIMETLEKTAPDLAVAEERLLLLEECIAELNPRQRQLIQLRYEAELEPAAIAERTSLQIDSVHVLLSRARASLRECVERKQRLSERLS